MTTLTGSSGISIHSLVKRETAGLAYGVAEIKISIHSLVKRETENEKHLYFITNDFNPLPRKEGDEPIAASKVSIPISIHSLVKRETQKNR